MAITAPKARCGSLNHLNTATSVEPGEPDAAIKAGDDQTDESGTERQPWPSSRSMRSIDGQNAKGNPNDGAASGSSVATGWGGGEPDVDGLIVGVDAGHAQIRVLATTSSRAGRRCPCPAPAGCSTR